MRVTPEQRALLREYRGHIAAVAEAGLQVGLEGVDLAGKAVTEALKGVFSGESERRIEERIRAEANAIGTSAQKICAHLPAMLATQQRLAAALPEFAPYARMTQEDVDDCRVDVLDEFKETANAAEEAAAASAVSDATEADPGR